MLDGIGSLAFPRPSASELQLNTRSSGSSRAPCLTVAVLDEQEHPKDGGRGKRRRKSVLTPEQMAGALDRAPNGSSSGSDFEHDSAAAGSDGADSEHDSGSGDDDDDDDLVPDDMEDDEPVIEPDEDLIDKFVDAVATWKPAKR